MKKISVELRKVTITDEHTGQTYKVETVRTAKELEECVEKSEYEAIMGKLRDALCEAYEK